MNDWWTTSGNGGRRVEEDFQGCPGRLPRGAGGAEGLQLLWWWIEAKTQAWEELRGMEADFQKFWQNVQRLRKAFGKMTGRGSADLD